MFSTMVISSACRRFRCIVWIKGGRRRRLSDAPYPLTNVSGRRVETIGCQTLSACLPGNAAKDFAGRPFSSLKSLRCCFLRTTFGRGTRISHQTVLDIAYVEAHLQSNLQ
jgi:hypothetical protein